MAATRTRKQKSEKEVAGPVPKHRTVGLSSLLAEQKSFDPIFVPLLEKHHGTISLGQLASEARSEGAPEDAIVGLRLWAASARRRGVINVVKWGSEISLNRST